MYLFGCLPFFLFALVTIVVMQALHAAGNILETICAAAVYLWQSFLNLFRTEKKEVVNPFNGRTNFDNTRQSDSYAYHPTDIRPKRYEATDGEYIEYLEL